MNRFTALALLFALPLAAAERRMLFAVRPHETYAVEPIVWLDPLEHPHDFVLRKGTKYVLSRDGNTIGSARVGESVQLGCVSNAAQAELSPRQEGEQWLLATNFTPAPSRPRRDATAAERKMLAAYARRFFRNRAPEIAALEQLQESVAVVDRGDGEPLFVASFITLQSGEHGLSLFFIARVADVTARKVLPQYLHSAQRDESYAAQGDQPLFALLDLDADGLAELITERHHKEGYDYVIYHRDANGRWRAFEGGGSGC